MWDVSVHGIGGQSATLDRMSSDMQPPDPPDTSPFATLAGAYLDELFADRPSFATFQGVDGLDDRSPDLSAAGFVDRERRADGWLERFGELADTLLTEDQRIDRDLVVSVLRGEQVRRDWHDWQRNPDSYLGPALMGVFSLFLVDALNGAADSLRDLVAVGQRGVIEPRDLQPALRFHRTCSRAATTLIVIARWVRAIGVTKDYRGRESPAGRD